MQGKGQASLGLLLVCGMLAGSERPQAAQPAADTVERKPVLLNPLDLNRLKGEVVCVYNFSTW